MEVWYTSASNMGNIVRWTLVVIVPYSFIPMAVVHACVLCCLYAKQSTINFDKPARIIIGATPQGITDP